MPQCVQYLPYWKKTPSRPSWKSARLLCFLACVSMNPERSWCTLLLRCCCLVATGSLSPQIFQRFVDGLEANASNSDVLSKWLQSPSVPTRAMGCCVINLGVIATFVSMWEQFSAVIPLFILPSFLLHHFDLCTVTKQQLAEAIKQLNACTGSQQQKIGCKC